MHFNTPKSKRRISIKKKRYTVNLSINLKGNVGNISMFVEILLWFNVISNRFVLLKRQVFLFIYTYTKYNRFVISFEANSKDERIYISQSARGQLSAWLESSSISFFCRRAENVLTSLENLFPSLRLSSSQKISIDSLPSKGIFPQTYIYIVI